MTNPTKARRGLPVILIAAVVQGGALYALHEALKTRHWPATDPRWLHALYSIALVAPFTVELLAEHARRSASWICIALVAGAYFYFGWYAGSVFPDASQSTAEGGAVLWGNGFESGFPLVILWLLVLPFIQGRMTEGRWIPRYELLFTNAWRNKLALAEALLFTGVFWLLLFLWAVLFDLLKIGFFKELFGEPLFVYPATCITFGIALHLIGSVDRFTAMVLEQLLNVLRWLALLAGSIVALFTTALLLKLPSMLGGEKAIGSTWLLWLIAVLVLLLNAAYRDGSVERPYPTWIATGLRVIQPLSVIVALTAAYGLAMRAREYGITVERVWGCIVAGAALCYTIGYAVCAVRGRTWFGGMSRVNTAVALGLIIVLCGTSSPILSPYRLAADSQYRLASALAATEEPHQSPAGLTPFRYLRQNTGRYGRAKLGTLARVQDGPHAERVRDLAQQALEQSNPWDSRAAAVDERAGPPPFEVFPAGHPLDPGLAAILASDVKSGAVYVPPGNRRSGVFVDLRGDGEEQFVFLGTFIPTVYEKGTAGWIKVGHLVSLGHPTPGEDLLQSLEKGSVGTSVSPWRELTLGTHRYVVDPQ